MNRVNWTYDNSEICVHCLHSLNSIEHFVKCIMQIMVDNISEAMRQNHFCVVDRFLSILMDSSLSEMEKKSKIFKLYSDLDLLLINWLKVIRDTFPTV